MALKIKTIDTFEETVSCVRPGESVTTTFKVRFKHLSLDKYEEEVNKLQNGEITQLEFVKNVLVGLPDTLDENNKVVDFETASAFVFSEVDLVNAIAGQFVTSLHGARSKNSKRSLRG